MNERAQHIWKRVNSGESRVWRESLTMCQGFPGHGEKIKDTDSSTPENFQGGGERGHIWGLDGKERLCVALLMNHSWSVLLGCFNGSEFSFHSVQFSSVSQSCATLCDPTDCSTPGLPVHTNSWNLLKLMSIESVIPSNHLIPSSPSPPTFILSQHQGLFKWVSSSHQVAKVLEFHIQYQSFQWIFRTDLL